MRVRDADDRGALQYLRAGGEHMYWWARAMAGETDEALRNISRLSMPITRTRTGSGFWYGLYAEILIAAGRLPDAEVALAEALSFAERTGERYPDAHRLLVESTLRRARGDSRAEVISILDEARDIATRQECSAIVARIDRTASAWDLPVRS